MEKITCDVISDLLPLYADHVCTQESCHLVEEHLKNCMECRSLLTKMQAECRNNIEETQAEEKIIKRMAGVWKKSVFKSFAKGIFAASCVFLLVYVSYWGLTKWPFVDISPTSINAEISVSDSDFTVSLRTTDGYKFTSMDLEPTEDGKMFITLKRGIIPIKNGDGAAFGGIFSSAMVQTLESGDTVQMKEIYYGTQKQNILLWKAE